MGHLLSSAIKMSAPSIIQVQYSFDTAPSVTGTFKIYKNGTAVVTVTSATALTSITVAAGDSIYATLAASAGSTLNYYKNAVLQQNLTGTSLTTSTVTAALGSTYRYEVLLGVI